MVEPANRRGERLQGLIERDHRRVFRIWMFGHRRRIFTPGRPRTVEGRKGERLQGHASAQAFIANSTILEVMSNM